MQPNKNNILTCIFFCCSDIIIIYSPAFWQKSVLSDNSHVSLTAGGNKSPGEVRICPEKKIKKKGIKHTHIVPIQYSDIFLIDFYSFFKTFLSYMIFEFQLFITNHKKAVGYMKLKQKVVCDSFEQLWTSCSSVRFVYAKQLAQREHALELFL